MMPLRPASSYSRGERALARLGNIVIMIAIIAFCLGLVIGAWLW